MGRQSRPATAGLFYACVLFALAATAIGGAGIIGVRAATAAGNVLAKDELATATTTALLSHDLDSAYASGLALALSADPAEHERLVAALDNQQIPAVEADLAAMREIHRADAAGERAEIRLLIAQWATVRNLLTSRLSAASQRTSAGQLNAAYLPLSRHLRSLIEREELDAREDQARASAAGVRTRWYLAGGVILAVLAIFWLGYVVNRRLRAALEPARDQVEFADTLQLAEDEPEAHRLLHRHLERLVEGATVTVLNRNNSADRLEAVTDVPAGSPLAGGLARAAPRSCLAIRSARSHEEDERRPALLGCPVCAGCPGTSTCRPLIVGGEVIGSVLLNRPGGYSGLELQQIRDSVGQAAPVLANLRNLAIAELRAATDSLTGLPNKRAFGDTVKQLLARASRTLEPLTLVMLDLDHFKDINDRFGHPVGDQALAKVGAAIRSAIRDGDFAARNGGEEFAVLLPATDVAGSIATAERVREAIAEITLPGMGVSLTASVGVAAYPEHALTTEGLERLADAALYVAKRSGRDRIEVAAAAPEGHAPWARSQPGPSTGELRPG